jgi:hypothetical protein
MQANPGDIWLNRSIQKQVRKMCLTDPLVVACHDRISQAILSGGIHYEHESGKKTNSSFKEELEEFWVPYAHHLFQDLFMFGYSALAIGSRRQLNEVLYHPVCVKFDDYTTLIRRKDYEYSFHCFPIKHCHYEQMKEDKKIKYLLLSHRPQIGTDGVVTTPVSTLFSGFQTLQRFYHYATLAESIRCNPQLVTQHVKGDRVFSEARIFEDFPLAEGNQFQQENHERRTEREALAFQRQQLLTEQLNSRGARNVNFVDSVTGASLSGPQGTGYEYNTFHLPEGKTTTQGAPVPTCRSDLIEMERMHQERICAVMGVPRAIVMSEHRSGSGSASEQANLTFRRTVDAYKSEMVRLLNTAYKLVYKVPAGKLSLPGTPLASVETIQTLYNEGVINGEKKAEYMMRSAGASYMDIDVARVKKFDQFFLDSCQKEDNEQGQKNENEKVNRTSRPSGGLGKASTESKKAQLDKSCQDTYVHKDKRSRIERDGS